MPAPSAPTADRSAIAATRLPASPRIALKEVSLLIAGSVLLAVAMFWPLVLHLGTDLPKDLGDPLPQAWQLAWGGHALIEQPLSFFQANQFWPAKDSLAFSDALVGYAPFSLLFGDGPSAAIARYDIAFIGATAVAFAGAYLLARELGLRPAAAVLAGAAFAYAPWRLEQGGHLHILTSGGIPLSLFLLLRGYRRGSPVAVIAGWLVVAWQVSIGFSLGQPFLLVLGTLALIAAVWWWRRGRPPLPRRLVVATVAGVVVVIAFSALLARPYLRVQDDQSQAARTLTTVAGYSAGPQIFLGSSALNPVWGPISAPVRDRLGAAPEQTLFPGLAILLLALAALTWGRWPRSLRWGLGGGAVVLGILSMGFDSSGVASYMPYRLLYEVVPGLAGVRVPERLNTFTSLILALLAAGGAARVVDAVRARGRTRLALALPAVLVAAVLLEGAGFAPGRWYPHPAPAAAPAGLAAVPAPLVQVPIGPDDNRRYLLWSTDGFAPMVNGRSSLTPDEPGRILNVTGLFPDRASVAALRRFGIRSVVIHADRVKGTNWAGWRSRPITGLGITRTIRGPLVIYDLRP
jgi:hypothetical protein